MIIRSVEKGTLTCNNLFVCCCSQATLLLKLYICSAEKDAFNLACATAFMKTGQTRLLAVFVLVLRVIFTLLSEVE